MIRKIHTIKINLPGGLITAAELLVILDAAEKSRVEEVRFGTRQQLYLQVQDAYLETLVIALHMANLQFEENEELYPNIMTSYVTQGLFQSTDWMTGKVYKDIIDAFTSIPTLKINIVDSEQSLVPLFTGNINFITSETPGYWFVYIRFPKTDIIHCWPQLVASADVPQAAVFVEQVILENRELFYNQPVIDGNLLQGMIGDKIPGKAIEQELESHDFRLPYYEGFNQYGTKLWLGIYRRDESFSIHFLQELCRLCQQTKIVHLFTTPWKSIIFKDILVKSRKFWELILGKYRINVRHASNELNWQVADLSDEGLNLKRYIIRQFDKDDVRTFGLCFAVEVHVRIGLFGSVVVYKYPNTFSNQRRSLDRYDILYTKSFDPNSKEYTVYRSEVSKEHLGTYLVSLCKFFYEEQMNRTIATPQPLLRQEVEK